MAIIGIGTDIVEISRFDTVNLNAIAKRVLTAEELSAFQQNKQPHRYLAKRWAAKEAAAKALGTGIAAGVTFHDFVISNLPSGAPVLQLFGKAAERLGNNVNVHISISDEKQYATATVIFESISA
ncbi:holo-ACP synthase [Catenovulum sediminis]|uniref:Holo-[acyl-carrier-protein] synthase n=1 Tax=Catenovulum sediminis TaxID=1740262 RepID=A0ABV1RK68_9ALTE